MSVLSQNLPDGCILRTENVLLFRHRGIQKEFLFKLKSTGPLALLKPQEVVRKAIELGLMPLFVDVPSHLNMSTVSLDMKFLFSDLFDIDLLQDELRKVLLNIALEQQLVDWLFICAAEFSNGSYSSVGCTLDFLLGWAFERAATLKNKADELCK